MFKKNVDQRLKRPQRMYYFDILVGDRITTLVRASMPEGAHCTVVLELAESTWWGKRAVKCVRGRRELESCSSSWKGFRFREACISDITRWHRRAIRAVETARRPLSLQRPDHSRLLSVLRPNQSGTVLSPTSLTPGHINDARVLRTT